MEHEAGMAAESFQDPGMLVDCVVIDDHRDGFFRRNIGIDRGTPNGDGRFMHRPMPWRL